MNRESGNNYTFVFLHANYILSHGIHRTELTGGRNFTWELNVGQAETRILRQLLLSLFVCLFVCCYSILYFLTEER